MNQQPLFPMPQTTRTTDDYYTPKWVFDALGIEFDLDVACPPEGPPHTPAKAWYTQETDGLASPWWGCVWMNPPYSKTTPWVDKWIAHGNGVALLPDLSRPWQEKMWIYSDAVVMLPVRMRFDVPDDRRGDIRYSVRLYAIGPTAVTALKNSGIGRVR